jgi:putative MATE family efflux protein
VGRFSEGADPLAGMGSAAALLTFSFYLFNFLCTATTPLVASKRAMGLEQDAVAVGGQALSLALGLGATVTMTLLAFRQPLLRIMGTGITGDAANGYALAFLSVRALAAPAVLSMEASTGVLRGISTQNSIVILVVANLINLLLDVALIAFAGLGPMGAAIATTSAEWISAGLFLGVLSGHLPSAGGQVGSNHRTQQGEKVSIVPLLSIPSWEAIQPLIVASSSILLRTFVLQVSLSAAAAMAARGGDTMAAGAAASVAAHQIGIQLWLLCSFFCDSLAAASQGLVADALGRKDPDLVRDISRTVFTYSLALGVFLGALLQIGESTNWLLDLFTQDADTRMALSAILPLIVLAQPLNALVFAADGVLQGAAEFPFQAKSMALSGATAVGTFVVLEAGRENVDMLVHIWTGLIALQFMRGLTSLWKIVDSNGPINLLATTK